MEFSASAQTAKNVGFCIFCTECKMPPLLHSKNKLKTQQPAAAKQLVQKLQYMCGASLNEYNGTGNDRDEEMLGVIFLRANLFCFRIILPFTTRVWNYSN